MKGQKRKIISIFLLGLCLLFASCGKKSQEGTAVQEATTEEDPTMGFQTARDYVVTIRDGVKLFREPQLMVEAYTVLNKGVNLRRTGTKGRWTRVRLNDTSLYVESSSVNETVMTWAAEPEEEKNHHVVFIDPAKQIYADPKKEPLFPSWNSDYPPEKQRMTKGAVGVATGAFEYEITLDVAEKLKHELELRGYTVILSRASHTASLSNKERAEAGNQSDAEIMLRLTAQGTENPETRGVLAFVDSADNLFTSDNYENNFYMANAILTEICSATDVNRLGIFQTEKTVFLNYAKKPAVTVQMGFLSNAEEDRNLSDPEYQNKLARGIANGIDTYFQYMDMKQEEEKVKENGEQASETVTEE